MEAALGARAEVVVELATVNELVAAAASDPEVRRLLAPVKKMLHRPIMGG